MMTKWTRWVRVSAVALALLGGGLLLAEDPETEEPPAEAESEQQPPSVESEPPVEPEPLQPKKPHFGLYVAVAGGGASNQKDLDTSIRTRSTEISESRLGITEHDFGRAAIGWKLREGKGDFRVVFQGYKETDFEFLASGLQSRLTPDSTQQALVDGLVEWWTVRIEDGVLVSRRTPRAWFREEDDTDMDGVADLDEVRRLPANFNFTSPFADTLQNQLQTVDLLYGREFGGRRFSSRWWGGLRYFKYDGNVPTAAWLATDFAGQGFTDGSFLRLINLSQDTRGFGPTGSWEVDFSFYDKGVVLFLRGQSAFVFNSTEMDSGEFFSVLRDPLLDITLTAPARLLEKRDKSTWHNTAEAGVRILLSNGLQFELGYSITGFLDTVLTPTDITIPERAEQVDEGTSAIFLTQDYVVRGFHAGIAFQF